MDVRSSYDSAAEVYADHLFDELETKPLDGHLLNRFAEATAGRGLVADVGCGPGHVAKYLRDRGVEVCGVDLSPEMIRVAAKLSPEVEFSVGDMRSLDFADESLAGIVSFYSIVHFDSLELPGIFHELRRVLHKNALVLLGFHIGDEVHHVDDLFGAPVSLDFNFHQPANVMSALSSENFKLLECTEREPYADVEYPSRRCYILAEAVSS